LVFEQDGGKLVGTHRGEYYAGDMTGSVEGSNVRFRSSHRVHGTRLGYEFEGKATGNEMSGTVNLGEYGIANWTAKKHQYQTMGGRRG
jgi:D-glucosaminate-6-phosphate ammonia-lyase